ncbi:MAG: amino acid adenylation domain-containing protein, partial [Acidobacteriaceae bacterium]|nr:amino acid adenylation domain-containing protein [Acidobacteriaceae bacterium]
MHSATENQRLLNVEHGAGVENGWAFPTSFAQQRLWLLNQLEPHNTAYSIPWSMRLHGDLNVEALEDSLNEIVSRHDVFRTTFRISQGEPIQFVADSLRIRLSKTDLSNWPERESEASRIAQQEADTPLNLESGPLIRSQLIRMSGCDHILLLTIHHIVFDGWSRRIFARELASCYQAFQLGEPSPLAPLPLQYADFAVWQRKLMSGKSFAKQLAYWKEQLANPPAALNLPTDRPRPAVQSHRGGRIPASLSPALSRRVVQFAREYNASIFMVLLAAFHALLSRYSGDEDILVGTPIANRTRPDIENLIGLFANTLVLRGRLAGNPSFAELVRRSKQTALDAYAHQDIPFEKLVEETNPERSLSRNPLFQVMFSLQNAASESFHLSGIEVKVLESKADTAKFDLSIFLSETEDGIRGRVEYNTDLYDRETIERLWKHYVRLLEAAIEKPELPFSQLPLLTDAERDQLLVEWNDTTADYPSSLCVHTWFEQQAERTPQSVACVWEETELSYRELNERANQLAWFLRRLGAAPGERVGVYLKRSAAMLVALLGVQKSGAAYVPLDPAYPAERLRLTLEQAGVTATVTEKELEDGLPEGGTGTSAARRVCLDRDAEAIARENRGNPACLAQPDDLIYVMFTSGSTGRPKGVEVSHRSVVNLLATMAEKLHMGPDDVFPALASFAFDVCIPELYLGLVTGGRVVIGRERLASDGHELAAFLRGVGATVVHATPTSWQLLLEAGFTGAGLKRAIGAEALPAGLSNRLLQADSSLYNFYGPTETTVWSTVHHFQNADEPIVIGRPLANTRIYILDPERQPVPVGVEGELYIGGTGVARGYLNRPDLTAERFLADPFRPGERMYRTGDRARYRSDGRIEYLGRADFQVKLRGYRIELGEIEAVLAQHPMVKQCVATVREDAPGDLRLVAYVVRQHSASAAETEWHRWLKERLPEYMVPAHIVTLENFPLSANGKVDRKQLPKVTYQRGDDEPYFAARTPVQDITAAIWCEVLKLQ